MRKTIRLKDRTVSFETGPEAQQAVYDAVLAWFNKQELYDGESLQQCDVTWVEGPNLLSTLADDVFKFKAKWDDQI